MPLLRQDTLDERLREEVPGRVRPDDQPALLVDVVEEPPGAVNRDTDSYTGEKI